MRLHFRRKIYDEYNDEEIELTKEERRLIGRVLKGKTPHADVDPYAVCIHTFSIFFENSYHISSRSSMEKYYVNCRQFVCFIFLQPYVDWFEWEEKGMPLSGAPEPKRRFIPSKWEHKKVTIYCLQLFASRCK